MRTACQHCVFFSECKCKPVVHIIIKASTHKHDRAVICFLSYLFDQDVAVNPQPDQV